MRLGEILLNMPRPGRNTARLLRPIALAALAILLAGVAAAAGQKVLSAPEAFEKAAAGEVLLIDIRSIAEWRQSGLPENAIGVTLHRPGGPVAFYEAILEAVGGDRDRPIALICAAGNRSAWAQDYLAKRGLTEVRNISEGMFGRGDRPGWIARGLPVKPCGC